MFLGERIREEREKRGMSQTELAELAGVHEVTISKWENGKKPSLSSLEKLARALGIPVTFLLNSRRSGDDPAWLDQPPLPKQSARLDTKPKLSIPIISGRTPACAGNGNGIESAIEETEEFIDVDRDAFPVLDDLRRPFAIYVDGDSMEEMNIPERQTVVITDVEIRKTKPGDKVIRLVDERGLFMEIRPTGRKIWKLRIWTNGKESKKTLGEYPAISLMRARQIRDEIKSSSTSPTDTTFANLAHEWLDIRMRPTKAPRYIETLVYKIDSLLSPHIGDKIVRSLTAPELLQVIRKIEARGTIETARRTRQMCGQILRYGVATGRCDRDISADLKGALKTVRHKHMATLTDPVQIGGLMRSIEEGLKGQIRLTLLFQAYTFARPGEIRKAEWEEIEADTWKIPAAKMKMKRIHWIPLSRQAIQVLEELRDISGHSRFLFPSVRSPKIPMSDMTVNAALRRLGYAQDEMTGHGFRSMFSTIANEHGWPPDVIERQLAHVPKNTVRAAYNHAEYLPQRRELMQWWADWLDEQKQKAR